MRVSKRLAAYRRQKNPSLDELRYRLRRLFASLLLFLVAVVGLARYFFTVPIWTRTDPLPIEPDLVILMSARYWWLAACFVQVAWFTYFLSTRVRRVRRLLSERGDSPAAHPTLWAWAYLLFSAETLETVFLPLLSDLELELAEAPALRGPGAARKILRRGYWIFWKTVGAQLCRSWLRRLRHSSRSSQPR